MGLLVVAAVMALVLTLLVLVTVALVQLVLFVTVRNTLLAAVVAGVYWFVDSRRRQVAKGFYSCTEVPDGVEGETELTTTQSRQRGTQLPRKTTDVASNTRRAVREGDEKKSRDTLSSRQQTGASAETVPSTEGTSKTNLAPPNLEHGDDVADEQRHSMESNASEAESCADEVPVAAATTSPTSFAKPSTSTSPMRLPDLRHRKWKHPTRSVPLPPAKGESLLQENRKSGSARGSNVRSASNSPRRPERYGSPRSVAMEQKLMKSALESDGYWIGDFRLPAPALAKRSTSTGAPTPTKSATKVTSAASFSSASSVTTSSGTAPATTARAYRRSNSHRV